MQNRRLRQPQGAKKQETFFDFLLGVPLYGGGYSVVSGGLSVAGWVVAFYDSKVRQHFRLSRLDCPTAKPGGAVNGGRSPFILTVDWLGWICYLPDKLELMKEGLY